MAAKLCTCGRPLPDADGLSWDREELVVWRHTRAAKLSLAQFDLFEAMASRLDRTQSMESMQAALERAQTGRPDFVCTARYFYVTLHHLRKRIRRLDLTITRRVPSRYGLFVLPWRE